MFSTSLEVTYIKGKLFSLQYKIIIFSFLIAIIPITIVGSFSYIKSSAVIKEKVSLSNFNTVKQVAENINLNINNMKKSFLYLSQNEVLVNVLMRSEEDIKISLNNCLYAQNALNNFIIFTPDIYSIYIDGFNTLCYDTASAENNIDSSLKKRLVNNRGETILILDSLTNYDNSVIKVISFLKVLYDINNISKKLALNRGEEITNVKNVVENLNYYILIQIKRYENMIIFNIEVEEETYECRIIKLIMQPIVENAIHHGIEKNGGKGIIDIKFRRVADDLIITVSDNGIGADEQEINGLLQKAEDNNRGFGIKKVNDRIRLIFGENYGIKFKTSTG